VIGGLAIAAALTAGIAIAPEGPPQLRDTLQPYLAAEPMAGDLKGALLLCRVDVVGEKAWDTFSAIDMRITLTAGPRAPVVVWGPEDRSSCVVGFPGVDAKIGEKWTFLVEDRDVTTNEFVARGSGKFSGTPFHLDLGDTQIDCRALPHEVAESRAADSIARASAALQSFDVVTPKLEEPGFGLDRGQIALDIDAPIAEATAWLGASDAQVKPLAQRRVVDEAAFHQRALDAIVSAKSTLPAPGDAFRIASLGLDAKVTKDAAVTLDLTPSGDNASFTDFDLARAIVFLSAGGSERELSATVVDDASRNAKAGEAPPATKLAHGQHVKVRLRPGYGAPVVADLLRADDVVVRAR
jgi:hypothetical protein